MSMLRDVNLLNRYFYLLQVQSFFFFFSSSERRRIAESAMKNVYITSERAAIHKSQLWIDSLAIMNSADVCFY